MFFTPGCPGKRRRRHSCKRRSCKRVLEIIRYVPKSRGTGCVPVKKFKKEACCKRFFTPCPSFSPSSPHYFSIPFQQAAPKNRRHSSFARRAPVAWSTARSSSSSTSDPRDASNESLSVMDSLVSTTKRFPIGSFALSF